MHKLLSLCLLLSLTFLLTHCGPRNPYISQQILGEWFMHDGKMQELESIKFHTNKTFDIKLNDRKKIRGAWSTLDSTASILDLQIDTYNDLHGNWKVEIADKLLSLSSTHSDAKYQFHKKK